ncbi:hypothetical protein H696_03942, partial [Fonticula alba]
RLRAPARGAARKSLNATPSKRRNPPSLLLQALLNSASQHPPARPASSTPAPAEVTAPPATSTPEGTPLAPASPDTSSPATPPDTPPTASPAAASTPAPMPAGLWNPLAAALMSLPQQASCTCRSAPGAGGEAGQPCLLHHPLLSSYLAYYGLSLPPHLGFPYAPFLNAFPSAPAAMAAATSDPAHAHLLAGASALQAALLGGADAPSSAGAPAPSMPTPLTGLHYPFQPLFLPLNAAPPAAAYLLPQLSSLAATGWSFSPPTAGVPHGAPPTPASPPPSVVTPPPVAPSMATPASTQAPQAPTSPPPSPSASPADRAPEAPALFSIDDEPADMSAPAPAPAPIPSASRSSMSDEDCRAWISALSAPRASPASTAAALPISLSQAGDSPATSGSGPSTPPAAARQQAAPLPATPRPPLSPLSPAILNSITAAVPGTPISPPLPPVILSPGVGVDLAPGGSSKRVWLGPDDRRQLPLPRRRG